MIPRPRLEDRRERNANAGGELERDDEEYELLTVHGARVGRSSRGLLGLLDFPDEADDFEHEVIVEIRFPG